MQIVVLGMHRSGTSAVARVLNLAGAYFGVEGVATPANAENSKGFWEREDVRALNDAILHSTRCDWDAVANFDLAAVPRQDRATLQRGVREVVAKLDAHRPWFIKEPRLCMTLPLWRNLLEFPVCVHIYRNPLEVARSLRARNDIPLVAGLALWEAYNVAALVAAAGLPRLFVAYHDLMRSPVAVAEALCASLSTYGGYPLRQPSANELAAFLSAGLHHQRATIDALEGTATDAQLRLFATLEDLRGADLHKQVHAPALSPPALQALRLHERQRRDVAESVREANAARMQRQQAGAETHLLLKSHELDRALGDLRDAKRELHRSRDEVGRLRNERSRQQRQLAVQDEQVRSLTAQRRELTEEVARQAAARHDVRRDLGDSVRELALAKADLVHETAVAADLRQELDGMVASNGRLQQEVSGLQRTVADARRRLADHRELQAAASQMRASVAQLRGGIEALLASRRWRLGHALLSLPHRLLLRRPPPTGAEALLGLVREPLPAAVGATPAMRGGPPPGQAPSRSVARRQRTTIAVLAWDVGHNPYGRAYLIADALSRQYRVVLIGFQFLRYGDDVWEPLRGAPLQPVVVPGSDFPEFQQRLESLVARIDPDVVIACKARLPTVQLGLMLKARRNRPLIVDVDDYEPSFFGDEAASGSVADLPAEALRVPHEGAWTRHVENLLPFADALLVSNSALQSKFGGVVVPHARDEEVFDAERADGIETRRRLGLERESRLVFFVGTPRPHKGLLELLAAIDESGVEDCRLVVVGTPPDAAFGEALASAGGDRLVLLPDQPFGVLPDLLAAADLVCLLQDRESPITEFQLPAKVVDALAMGVPVLATPAPPLDGLISAGLVQATTRSSAPAAIKALLAMPDDERERRAQAARRWFLERASYRAILGDLSATVERALATPKPLPGAAHRFLEEQEDRFRTAAAGPQTRSGIDIVMFWKQNDVGLYGRRFEMIVEYLRGRPEIGRIAVFEPPVPDHVLDDGDEAPPPTDQQGLLAHSRLLRRWRLMDRENVSYHAGPADKPAAGGRRMAFEDYVAAELEMLGLAPRRAVFWHYPYFEHSLAVNAKLRPRLKLVDVVDDQRTWENVTIERRDLLDRHYREVLGDADIVVANCEQVARSMASMAREILVVPNGCDTRSPPPAPRDFRFRQFSELPRPVVGVVGNLEPKTDSALLHKLATERPTYQLALIGSTHAAEPELLRLAELPNVTFFGVVTYPEVRAWVSALDVALVPHRNTEQTRAMHPLKVLVYAAESVPVVATDIENLGDFAPFMRVAASQDDFLAAVDDVVEGRFRVAKERLRAAARRNSWERRVDQIMTAVTASLG